jgi:CRISPR/Cas system CSM-associated protein Csm3 (group 7 of RAMP superfamily)
MSDDIPTPFEDPPDIPKMLSEQTGFRRSDLVHALFGSVTWRSPLRFADLPTTIVSYQQAQKMHQDLSQIRPSVSINRRRGTAEDQRLLFQETALEGMVFESARAITGDLGDGMPPEQYAALLWAALKLTDRWGGAKSRGLGWAMVETFVKIDDAVIDEETLVSALRTVLTQPRGAQ